jgi:hypothetical protein
MIKKRNMILLLICLCVLPLSGVSAFEENVSNYDMDENKQTELYDFDNDYGIQWEMNYGNDDREGARYEGPQPIGDCDNDGKNELLISGRDAMIRVMEWDENKQTYIQTHILRCPFYWLFRLIGLFNENVEPMDAGGFAIGDLTGDGKNEIAATWYAAVYRYIRGHYRIIGFNPWIFWNGGGNADCYIGDCDNDGKNELIMSGGPAWHGNPDMPEIVIFKWNGIRLVKVAEWDDPGVSSYVYMAGLGDVDYDGENEIVCGSARKVVVLDWNKESKEFEATVIKESSSWQGHPFACVCKDSDMDGKDEIHVGFRSPWVVFFKWNGTKYETIYEKTWPGEDDVIEALDVGDVDDDGIAEVCVGTNIVHILQWNGTSYEEEAVLPTWGGLAVTCIGDCDNDGKNEINVGSVWIDHGEDYMEWVFKYKWEPKR